MPSGASDPQRPPVPSAAFDFDAAIQKQLERVPDGHNNAFAIDGSKEAGKNGKVQAALYVRRPDGWQIEVYVAGEEHHGVSAGAKILKSW